MDLIYTNANREDVGVIPNYELDLAFGSGENDFECKLPVKMHCCEPGSLIYIDGTEYGGIVDKIGSDTELHEVTYSGRTWHGILASKIILPLQDGEESPTQTAPVTPSRLPDGYTELESIISSGEQYIDTGVVPNANTKAVLTFRLTNPNTSNQAVFGVAGQFSFRWYGGSSCFRSNGGNSVDFPKTIDATATHTVVKDALTTTIDDTYTVNTTAGNVSQTLYLFAQHHATSGAQTLSSIEVFSFQMYNSNVLVRDFVPCRNPSNVVGLYDLVNSVFYPNLGSGTFTAGAVVEPPEPEIVVDVTIKLEDSDGISYVDKYLIISGDANRCIGYILDRCNLTDTFTASEEIVGVSIQDYQFHRYTDVYAGLTDMLQDFGLKLKMQYQGNTVVVSAVEVHDYSQDKEFDSDIIGLNLLKQYKSVNHLICLGTGELENRMVVHLYADENGDIVEKQAFFGIDEYAAIYDYSNVESEEELVREGKQRFKELRTDSVSLNINETDDLYDIGDTVGATDNITGIFVADVITKKIVTIKNGQITISYKVGD